MKALIMASLLALSMGAEAKKCSKMCDPAKSKPSGAGCIPLTSKARKTWTTACVGKSEAKDKPEVKPVHQDEAPK